MASNDYHFITHWRVQAQQDEVYTILADAESLPRWWPAVYLEVRQLTPGDAQGIGKRVDLYTKGWLPYTLRWQFTVTEVTPNGFSLVAEGDLEGRGIWTFEQTSASHGAAEDNVLVNITYDWKIEANKLLLKILSFALKPLFAMNHEWAMQQGERSLELELRHRRLPENDTQGHAAIPAPLPATPSAFLSWLAYVLTHPRSQRHDSG